MVGLKSRRDKER